MKTTLLALVASLISLVLLGFASWVSLFGQDMMLMALSDGLILVVCQLILLICLLALLWRARKARQGLGGG